MSDNFHNVPDENWHSLPIRRGQRIVRHMLEILKPTKAVICGGFARWLVSPKDSPADYGDIDVFAASVEDFDRVKSALLAAKFETEFENNISIAYKPKRLGWWTGKQRIQLIKPLRQGKVMTWGTLKEILGNFDFTIVRAGVLSETHCLVDKDFSQDETDNLLRMKTIHCPILQVTRLAKYHKKGYRLLASQVVDIFKEWDERKPEIKKALVDTLGKMKGGKASKKEVDDTYRAMAVD